MSVSLSLTSLGACATQSVGGIDPNELVRTFTFEMGVDLVGTPDQAWEHFTGDLKPWWDHTFSAEPESLILDARVGGSFYEAFDRRGNGAEHAKVIYAERGKMLRLDGPLGLSGLAVHLVYEIRFSKREGEGSRIDIRVQGMGAVDKELVETLEAVWHHFLVERFEPYLRAQIEGKTAADAAALQERLDNDSSALDLPLPDDLPASEGG